MCYMNSWDLKQGRGESFLQLPVSGHPVLPMLLLTLAHRPSLPVVMDGANESVALNATLYDWKETIGTDLW